MTVDCSRTTRRRFLAGAAALGALPILSARAQATAPIMRAIPSTGEKIPAIGMGTWVEFNVGNVEALRENCLAITRLFLERGGGMIDSSPMYGSAEDVVGWCLERITDHGSLFSATKVWSPAGGDTAEQLSRSEGLWRSERLDLMQVHNLVDAEEHLERLFAAKAAGRIRYVGITTSHGARHDAMAEIMTGHPIDFAQFTYNILDREAEDRLLPLAADRGIAVIANRPFQRKGVFRHVGGAPLPGWAADIGAANWAQVFLKFVIAHPAVTCAIPATSVLAHMDQNMGALTGPLPDARLARRMAADVAGL
ncbi:MAG: aldo/keto reductase [Rhodospirillales bacterium]